MTDLFSPTTPHDTQDDLRIAMIASHAADLKHMQDIGIMPPWLEDDSLLDHDEYAILTYISDRGGCEYKPREFYKRLGYASGGNFKASMIKCRDRKLVVTKEVDGIIRIGLSVYGSYLLDMVDDMPYKEVEPAPDLPLNIGLFALLEDPTND